MRYVLDSNLVTTAFSNFFPEVYLHGLVGRELRQPGAAASSSSSQLGVRQIATNLSLVVTLAIPTPNFGFNAFVHEALLEVIDRAGVHLHDSCNLRARALTRPTATGVSVKRHKGV